MMQLVAVLLLGHVAVGVSLHADTSIMRRENLEMGSRRVMALDSGAKSEDTCDDVFMEGTEGEESCKDPANQRRIDASMKELCVVAAGDNAGDVFEISYVYYHVHPAGCFIENGKYFFNPTYQAPNQTTVGIPVCVTTRFTNGSPNSNSCPGDYEFITNEDECRFAARCLSRCEEGQFNVTGSEEERYPQGCHVRGDDKCYSFSTRTSVPADASLEGTPVCRLTSAPPYSYGGLVAVSGRMLDTQGATHGQASDSTARITAGAKGEERHDNPCSYLGCNSAKCEWASGGRIRRIVAAKGCSNALVLGSGEGSGNTTTRDGLPLVQIQTLKQCMNAVRARQDDACSGHFQLHKDTWTCSCVPSGSKCTEQTDEKVCRFQVVD